MRELLVEMQSSNKKLQDKLELLEKKFDGIQCEASKSHPKKISPPPEVRVSAIVRHMYMWLVCGSVWVWV